MVQACEHIFSDKRSIIMMKYMSGQKSNRRYAVLQRVVIRKNATFWRLRLRDVDSNCCLPDFSQFLPAARPFPWRESNLCDFVLLSRAPVMGI